MLWINSIIKYWCIWLVYIHIVRWYTVPTISTLTACFRLHQLSVSCVLAVIPSTGSVSVFSLLLLMEVVRCPVWFSPVNRRAWMEPTPTVLLPSLARVYQTNRAGISVLNSCISGWEPVTGFCWNGPSKSRNFENYARRINKAVGLAHAQKFNVNMWRI